MGNPIEDARPRMRLWSRAADLCSRLLEPAERDVVLGDLTESNVRERDAFVAVSSLVVRRQLALWTDWRPWLAVTGISLPIGLVLSVLARSSADGKAIYAVLYINRFQWLYVENPGSRHHMIALATGFALDCLTLVLWSWTAGFVLGRLSRRVAWITAAVLALAVLAATMGTETTVRMYNDRVFSLHFYGVVFPRLMRFGFVLLPALSGLRRALAGRWPPLPVTMAGALVILALTAWSARSVEAALTFGRGLLPLPGPDGVVGTADDVTSWRFVPFLLLWPAAFIVAGSLARQWRRWRPLLVALLAVTVSVVSLRAQQPALDYTQWRGDTRDGSASGFVEPSVWPATLTRRWAVTVGEGYGTPLAIGDTVYVFTRRDGHEVMTALGATTGHEPWRSGYAAAYTTSQPTIARGGRRRHPSISFVKDVDSIALWTLE